MEREKALDMALSQIERQFGEGAVMKMGERGQMKVEAVSTGSLAIDMALGILFLRVIRNGKICIYNV